MKKKPSPSRVLASDPGPHNTVFNSHNIPGQDLFPYARSFHEAAKILAGTLQPDANPITDFDACPVVFMYRRAIELHLKALVLGDGSNFLPAKPDPLSICKTHSVPWLAQFVCQIVTASKGENEFKCEGIRNLADFKASIEDVNSVDPGSCAFRYPVNSEARSSVPSHPTFSVCEFARKMDALLELLNSAADALAAEWDMRSEAFAIEAGRNDCDFDPPTQ